jgi:hypothetical protein
MVYTRLVEAFHTNPRLKHSQIFIKYDFYAFVFVFYSLMKQLKDNYSQMKNLVDELNKNVEHAVKGLCFTIWKNTKNEYTVCI